MFTQSEIIEAGKKAKAMSEAGWRIAEYSAAPIYGFTAMNPSTVNSVSRVALNRQLALMKVLRAVRL